MCGLSSSRSDFLISGNVIAQGAFIQSIKAEGYHRWGKYIDSLALQGSNIIKDVTWLYSCKVSNDSSSLYISGSLNF